MFIRPGLSSGPGRNERSPSTTASRGRPTASAAAAASAFSTLKRRQAGQGHGHVDDAEERVGVAVGHQHADATVDHRVARPPSSRDLRNVGDSGSRQKTHGRAVIVDRKVLLASGVRDRLPEFPGLLDLHGRSVFHCPYCDGWELRGRALASVVNLVDPRIIVLGGGASPTTTEFSQIFRCFGSHSPCPKASGPGSSVPFTATPKRRPWRGRALAHRPLRFQCCEARNGRRRVPTRTGSRHDLKCQSK